MLLSTVAAAGPGAVGAAEAARLLDTTAVLHSANVAGATGFLLSATTSWGFFRYRWVTVKFVLTVVALGLGIALLSPRVDATVAAVRAGRPGEQATPATLAALMACAFALQVWLSVAKPGGRVRQDARPRPAPTWMAALAVLAPVADVAVGLAVGNPIPVLSLLTLAVAGVVRRRRTTRTATGRPAGPSASAASP